MKPFHLHTQNLGDLANCIMSNGGVSNTIADVERVVVMHDDLYNQYYYIFHFCLIIGRDTLNLIVYYTIPHPHHIQYTHKRNISTHPLPYTHYGMVYHWSAVQSKLFWRFLIFPGKNLSRFPKKGRSCQLLKFIRFCYLYLQLLFGIIFIIYITRIKGKTYQKAA